MPHNRFFFPLQFVQGESITLDRDESHHIKNVMRIDAGSVVEIINGKGECAEARVTSLRKNEVVLHIGVVQRFERLRTYVNAALPLLRPSCFDWACEKLIELGVDTIAVFLADYSEKKVFGENFFSRIERIIESVLKQSGRMFAPEVRTYSSLKELLEHDFGDLIWSDIGSTIPLLTQVQKTYVRERPLLVLSGPEKGWSEQERMLLQRKAFPVLLSDAILRAETAAIVMAATALQIRMTHVNST